jgi:hypothetical protein
MQEKFLQNAGVGSLMALTLLAFAACTHGNHPRETPSPKRAPEKVRPVPIPSEETPEPAGNPVLLSLGVLVDVDRGHTLRLDDVIEEAIAAAAGDKKAYPAGSGLTLTLSWDGQGQTFSKLSAGYEGVDEIWVEGYRLRLGRIQVQPLRVEIYVDRIDPGQETAISIKKGETLRLDGQFHMRFDSHSHKRTRMGGPSSPLMINLIFLQGDVPVESKTFYVHEEDARSFKWRNFTFTLGPYQYDAFMELKMDAGKLVPIQAVAPTPP